MTWNHRIIRRKHEDGEYTYAIHEVHYNKEGEIFAWTEEPVSLSSENILTLMQEWKNILEAFTQPLLDENQLESQVKEENITIATTLNATREYFPIELLKEKFGIVGMEDLRREIRAEQENSELIFASRCEGKPTASVYDFITNN